MKNEAGTNTLSAQCDRAGHRAVKQGLLRHRRLEGGLMVDIKNFGRGLNLL